MLCDTILQYTMLCNRHPLLCCVFCALTLFAIPIHAIRGNQTLKECKENTKYHTIQNWIWKTTLPYLGSYITICTSTLFAFYVFTSLYKVTSCVDKWVRHLRVFWAVWVGFADVFLEKLESIPMMRRFQNHLKKSLKRWARCSKNWVKI